MKRWKRRLTAWLLVLLLALGLGPQEGRAVLSEVYFTAVNEQLLDLNSETMPFLYGGVWYVSSRLFEGTDLGVNYARIYNANQAMLYNAKIDLRFDLDTQTTTDRNGKSYNGYAIERGGVIFFPLPLVCSRFGLRWSKTETETVPLIRVTSSSAVLTDREFVDAASQMRARYNEYERSVTAAEENTGGPPQTEDPPWRRRARRSISSSTASPRRRRWSCWAAWGTTRPPSCSPRRSWSRRIWSGPWWPGATAWPSRPGGRRRRRWRRRSSGPGSWCGRPPARGWSWCGAGTGRRSSSPSWGASG